MNFILEFNGVKLAAPTGQAAMDVFSLRLPPGEILMICVEHGNELLPLPDAALGLTAPTCGRTLFQGVDWSGATPEQVLQMRARIGRVFDRDGWISNLDVIENITLAQRHHTRRPIAEILEEAQTLAQSFGLPEAPRGRPAAVPHRDLRRAEWVRAFMGQPDFICLERPGQGVATEHIAALAQAAQKICARGGAVLWITDADREIKVVAGAKNIRHCAMHGAKLTGD